MTAAMSPWKLFAFFLICAFNFYRTCSIDTFHNETMMQNTFAASLNGAARSGGWTVLIFLARILWATANIRAGPFSRINTIAINYEWRL